MADGQFSDRDYRDQSDFRYAIRRFLRFSELHARAAGITPQQHVLLAVVRGHTAYPAVSIGQIAERLQLKHQSTSVLVDRAVQRGLLWRQEDPGDRRRAVVALTPEGQRVLNGIMAANRTAMRALEDELFPESLRRALNSP
jgi:DNA-binding MarR family transcriptional regulator